MDSRRVLLRAMQAELNCWMWEFAHTTGELAKALLGGRVTAELLAAYPENSDYPELLSRGICAQAGLDFDDTSSEAVGLAVDNLRAVASGQVSIHGPGFAFYEETLDTHGLTLERAGELMREHSGGMLAGAAGLLIDAFRVSVDEANRDHRPPIQKAIHGRMLDFRFRVWKAEHGVSYDDLPRYDQGGPAIVSVYDWFVSQTVPSGWSPAVAHVHDGKTVLNVWRGDYRAPQRHPLDGTRYDTQQDAHRAAFAANLIGFMVYETQAHKYPVLNP